MSTVLHVHRLPSSMTDSDLQKLFEGVGRVINCDVVTDGTPRSSKAIGFVEMATEAEALRAIDELDGKELSGRVIRVSEGA